MRKLALAALAGVLAACSQNAEEGETASSTQEAAKLSPKERLEAIVAGEHRSEAERARDAFRNPAQTLLFFGLTPDMNVVEIWPGGGWYTNIIAPFVAGDGSYTAASLDPAANPRAADAVAAFKAKYAEDVAFYGEIGMTALYGDAPIAEPGSADMVLTFRNVHNWLGNDSAPTLFSRFYEALKPGGVLGVVEHRAVDPNVDPSTGYMTEDQVIALAEGAGFKLEERSEINANEADTRDHPFGVWTLPPVRRSSEHRGVVDPDFDRAKYDAIGESDRMTLKFVKPATDGDDA